MIRYGRYAQVGLSREMIMNGRRFNPYCIGNVLKAKGIETVTSYEVIGGFNYSFSGRHEASFGKDTTY
jgi:hypothetical protein